LIETFAKLRLSAIINQVPHKFQLLAAKLVIRNPKFDDNLKNRFNKSITFNIFSY